MSAIRVLVVDDHSVVRAGLAHVLAGDEAFEIVAEAANAADAVERAAESLPDVVLLDITMPGGSGLQAVGALRRAAPGSRILVLSVHDRREYVIESVRAGAHGYLRKDASPADLRAAIRAVHAGGSFFGPSVAAHVAAALGSGGRDVPPGEPLTPREREVLRCIARGLSNKAAAAELEISVRTVETHRDNLMQKLGLRGTAALTKYALEQGLLET